MSLWLKDLRDFEHSGGLWWPYVVPKRIAFLCLLASVVFPSLGRAEEAPVFVIAPVHS